MNKRLTCILCPNGCKIKAELSGSEIIKLEGARCPKGKTFLLQEINNPQRNIATSVLVKDGELELASVRLNGDIPRDKIFEVMNEIRKLECTAPLSSGQVLIRDVLGLGVDVICTKSIGKSGK